MVTVAAAMICLLTLPAQAKTTWRSVKIGGGGFTTGIITHPRVPGLRYIRTDMGGAYRWDDRRKTWIPLLDWATRLDWNLYGVESLAVDPADPKRVYMALGTYTNDWAGNGAFVASNDQGRSWKRFDLPFKNGGNEDGRSIGERLAVDPNDGRVLFFGTRHNGLLRSADRGATWTSVKGLQLPPTGSRGGVGWVVFDGQSGAKGRPTPRILVGAAEPGIPIQESLDAGSTWRKLNGQPNAGIAHRLALTPDGLVVVYSDALGPNGITSGSVWRLGGRTWREITPEKPGPGNTFGYAGLCVDPSNPEHIVVSTMCRWSRHDTVFETFDGGQTWDSLKDRSVNDGSPTPFLNWDRPKADFGHWIGDVELDPFQPTRAWYVTGATIWATENLREKTVRWRPQVDGFEQTAVLDLLSPTEGAPLVSAVGDIGGFRHDDLTVSPPSGIWVNPLMNTVTSLAHAENRPLVFVRAGSTFTNRDRVAISRDGARTWQPLRSEPPGSEGRGSIAVSPTGDRIVYAPQNGAVFETRDLGQTWEKVLDAGRETRVLATGPFTFAHERNAVFAYVRAESGPFERVAAPGPIRHSATFAPTPGRVWCAMDGKVTRLHLADRTWQDLSTQISAEYIGLGKAAPGRIEPTIFVIGQVAGKPGVFMSTDDGKTWRNLSDAASGFGTMQYITGDPKLFGRVYLGTNGRGILYADVQP